MTKAERERDQYLAQLNAANKALQSCAERIDQLEAANRSLAEALQTLAPPTPSAPLVEGVAWEPYRNH
jgi:prefoldin subunit 5